MHLSDAELNRSVDSAWSSLISASRPSGTGVRLGFVDIVQGDESVDVPRSPIVPLLFPRLARGWTRRGNVDTQERVPHDGFLASNKDLTSRCAELDAELLCSALRLDCLLAVAHVCDLHLNSHRGVVR